MLKVFETAFSPFLEFPADTSHCVYHKPFHESFLPNKHKHTRHGRYCEKQLPFVANDNCYTNTYRDSLATSLFNTDVATFSRSLFRPGYLDFFPVVQKNRSIPVVVIDVLFSSPAAISDFVNCVHHQRLGNPLVLLLVL